MHSHANNSNLKKKNWPTDVWLWTSFFLHWNAHVAVPSSSQETDRTYSISSSM